MGRGPFALTAALLAVAALVSGCGGSGGGDSTTTSVSKAAFIKKADAVCQTNTQRMQRQILAVLKTKNGIRKPKPSEYERLVGTIIVPAVQREIKDLRALPVPSGDEDRIDAMIGALEEGLETAENDPKAVEATSDVVFGIFSRLAGEYGLTTCASR
jgi:hypothetical protein